MAIIVCSCGQNAGKKQDQTVAQGTPVVSVAVASKQNVPQTSVYSATVSANVINNIASQSAGRIQKLNVDVGDFVSAGQVLAEMDRVQLDQAALRLSNQETELNRVKGLLEAGGISQSDYDALNLSYKVAKSAYNNLLENTILRAPVSGVVTARNYDRGDMYTMASPIYTVQQITPVKILVAVSETDYTKVKRGDSVTITADAIPGKEFSGSIVRLYPVMDPSSHTFNVEVSVKNTGRELRPGMYARVSVNFGDNVSIVIPDSALGKQQGSGDKIVYLLKEDGTVDIKVVAPGRHFDGKYEILSGINEGDKVVTNGQTSLRSGDKVEVAQ